MGQTRYLLIYFCSFHKTNLTINDKNGDGCLGLKPMAADESTELTTKVQTLENENKREEGK